MRKRRHQPEAMPVTEHELLAMTDDLDEMHRDAMPKVYAEIAEWAELNAQTAAREIGSQRPNRRWFLTGSAIALGGVALAACSNTSTTSSGSSATSAGGGASTTAAGKTGTTAMGGGASTDLQIAALATGLENLAVATYQAGIDAATANKLGDVPPAVVTFAQTAQQQHKDHAAAWNAILSKAGQPTVTGVDMTVKTGVVDPAFAQVKDVPGLAKLALQLEDVAAATYLGGLALLTDKTGIATSATIQPVEMQHAAILNFVLGQYPVPKSFASTEGARGPDDKIG